jgi:peptidoglycan hydrolase-like protein with peptidoglycan-binding domain
MGQGVTSMKRALKFLALSAFLVTASLPGFAQSTTGSGSASSSTHSTTTAKKKTVSKKHHSKREPTQKAPTPARISEIQTALERRGYYQGDPNGKWDSNTVNAMQKFQSENGLESSGKINALSLQKLGLGSSIAGVSAPKPLQPQPSKPAASSPSPAAASAQSASASAPAQSASAINTNTGTPTSLSTSSASPASTAKPQQR